MLMFNMHIDFIKVPDARQIYNSQENILPKN